jgi:hypothetical protein
MMSIDASDVSTAPVVPTTTGEPGRPRRRRALVATVAVAAVVVALVLVITNPFAAAPPTTAQSIDSTSVHTVTRGTLTSQTQVNATLGYAGSYTVTYLSAASTSPSASSPSSGAKGDSSGSETAGGTVTALPAVGQVVSQGQSLYSVSGSPVVLLDGSTPSYRTLSEGMSGEDVTELNADLVYLGYAGSSGLDPTSDYFSPATASALEALQAQLGLPQTGSLPLGQAVFLPTAARVTSLSVSLGQPISSGTPVLEASSTTRQVSVDLDASQQADVAVGDKVTITLPNNQTTPGEVTSVGTVATCPSNGGGSSGSGSSSGGSGSPSAGACPSTSTGSASTPTITVDVTPTDPSATGTWDQAPVQVTITTGSASNALIVPVAALLAQAGGGYAVEVIGANGADRLVPVTLGLFDDADGLVQVSGSGLEAGQKVVVPNV